MVGRFCLAGNVDIYLSPRQTEALILAACGMTDIEAARRMGVSPRTIRGYLQDARQRLNASNTTHAVALAIVGGVVELDTNFLRCGATSAPAN